MFDRITCVSVRIKGRGHLVMSIMQFMHLISGVHFWAYLQGEVGGRERGMLKVRFERRINEPIKIKKGKL